MGAAALLLLVSVAAVDLVLVAGAAWISHAILDHARGSALIIGLCGSAIALCCALLAVWRVTRGYGNLRRLMDDVRNPRKTG